CGCSCDAEPLLDAVQTGTQMAPIELLEQHVRLAPERLLVLRLAGRAVVRVRLVHGEDEFDARHIPDAPGLGRGAISVRPAAARQHADERAEDPEAASDQAAEGDAADEAAEADVGGAEVHL